MGRPITGVPEARLRNEWPRGAITRLLLSGVLQVLEEGAYMLIEESLNEEFLGSFCAFVGNGLLIFRDVNSIDAHADWEGQSEVHAVQDSIYLCVQHPVDGPVTADLFEDGSANLTLDGATLFDGNISSSQGEFVLHDPNESVKLRIVTDRPGQARLRISGDEESRPTVVRLQIWY